MGKLVIIFFNNLITCISENPSQNSESSEFPRRDFPSLSFRDFAPPKVFLLQKALHSFCYTLIAWHSQQLFTKYFADLSQNESAEEKWRRRGIGIGIVVELYNQPAGGQPHPHGSVQSAQGQRRSHS